MEGETVCHDVVGGDVGLVLVALDRAEVVPVGRVEALLVVQAQVHLLDRVLGDAGGLLDDTVVVEVVVAVLVLLLHDGEEELDDGVVEGQVELLGLVGDLGRGGHGLDLGDEDLERALGEPLALLQVEVDVLGLELDGDVAVGDLGADRLGVGGTVAELGQAAVVVLGVVERTLTRADHGGELLGDCGAVGVGVGDRRGHVADGLLNGVPCARHLDIVELE